MEMRRQQTKTDHRENSSGVYMEPLLESEQRHVHNGKHSINCWDRHHSRSARHKLQMDAVIADK